MTWQELQHQILQLSLTERWHLIQSLLSSIQRETQTFSAPNENINHGHDLNPWTQRLIGVIKLNEETALASYADYLEQKYR
ncbi:hypothetical protein GlitD10_1217 [Gloeomargarita lithophora Alchichica-D10]|uniref:Uncharacterized protein n=1 Tax=Gloeomargarita lithophora Alchichica-D10 TaxID=1188229 RepID=A0A1J0ACA5_9CYAN|nr:hypothetical protein [Gloeomargarita lithophora]APB33537.1 hypothetical protein GlitD10_1217 [Gloeomargarita lithophora Alchichica-D10]